MIHTRKEKTTTTPTHRYLRTKKKGVYYNSKKRKAKEWRKQALIPGLKTETKVPQLTHSDGKKKSDECCGARHKNFTRK